MKRFLKKFCYRLLLSLSSQLKKTEIKQGQDLLSLSNSSHIADGSIISGEQYIHIGDGFRAGQNIKIQAIDYYNGEYFKPLITIGNWVSFEDYCHIGSIEKISIGDNTMIASRVTIIDHFHGNITHQDINAAPRNRPLTSKPIIIGKNVWIGEGVCIMPGVTLGDNVIVGANAVVTHDFPANYVIAGCPAKVIKML